MENNLKFILYCTTNIVNNKIYIGVHKTNPNEFDGYIGCGVYISRPSTYERSKSKFHYAVKKYGVKNFKRSIIQIFDNEEDAYELESYIVNNEFLARPDVYNTALGGTNGSYILTCKKVYQYDLSTQAIVNKFESISDAARWVEINTDSTGSHKRVVMSISELCNNKYEHRKSYFGFGWCFVEEYIYIKKYTNNRGDKSVLQYTLTGDFIKQWPSISEAQRTLGINNIGLACAGKRKKAGGFKWKYSEDLDTIEV